MAEHTAPVVTVEQASLWHVSVNGGWIGDVDRVEGTFRPTLFGANLPQRCDTLEAAVAVLVGAWKARQP